MAFLRVFANPAHVRQGLNGSLDPRQAGTGVRARLKRRPASSLFWTEGCGHLGWGGTGSSSAFLTFGPGESPQPVPVLLIDKFGRAIHGERCATPWLLM